MANQYRCENQKRAALVRDTLVAGNPVVNGIDFVEVSPDELHLTVHFIHPLFGPALTPGNFHILGGVRVTGIHVVGPLSFGTKAITLTLNAYGDYSPYTLRIVESGTENPPNGYDRILNEVRIYFKVNCDDPFDCAPDAECPPDRSDEPIIDYLAKDYGSFRRLMMDRLSVLAPAWADANPADAGVALMEAVAYTADSLSYFQDAVGTEAYLGTALRRRSIRRHSRLVGYRVHDGVNARTWVAIRYVAPIGVQRTTMPGPRPGTGGAAGTPGTLLLTRQDAPAGPIPGNFLTDAATMFFETMHDLLLFEAHNEIRFYTWGDGDCCLPKGATKATLRDDAAARLRLMPGDVLIFEETVSPTTGVAADADIAHRHAVRLKNVTPAATNVVVAGVGDREPSASMLTDTLTGQGIVELEWESADALPFPLCLSATIDGAEHDVSRAAGNVVLADEGKTVLAEQLDPPDVPPNAVYRPKLRQAGIASTTPYLHADNGSPPARRAIAQDPREALPAVCLTRPGELWAPQRDLLESDSFATEFVVEQETDGTARIRFGDGILGEMPSSSGGRLIATYRTGQGAAGNVGADAIAHVVTPLNGIVSVRNPIAAAGGTDPEALEDVRLYAPEAFRRQERAVTEEDYGEMACRHPEVQRAVGTRRWTGSWHTVFVTIDRTGGLPVDVDFQKEIREHLEPYRMAGEDLEIQAPIFVSLEIVMAVCVEPSYLQADIRKQLLELFSNRDLPDGRRGFFHPDNLSFGQSIYLSQLVALVMSVPGVVWVDTEEGPGKPTAFHRWGKPSRGEEQAGEMTFGRLEIPRLDNDPSRPENGRIDFVIQGGR